MAESIVNKSTEKSSETKRGYLECDFRFFHLKDRKSMQFESHYHDFDKIIIFISGNVTYLIEGRAYKLSPWDMLLIGRNEMHKPVIDPTAVYERIVIWVNPDFLDKHSSEDCRLESCFRSAAERGCNLLRPGPDVSRDMKRILNNLEDACQSSDFGHRILENSLFLQMIVTMNRLYSGMTTDESRPSDMENDETVGSIIEYINSNLGEEMSIDIIAEKYFISRYYLMHTFKRHTGYSLHNYILQKRLILAGNLIKSGVSAAEASIRSGFADYSNFIRSFKRMYGQSPREYGKSGQKPPNGHFRS
ncbi:MAG: AraC family transcriptional regulator [Clostridiales bacterium]|nr:AraC family transcriptional regulator [Clostridiales bacterium]